MSAARRAEERAGEEELRAEEGALGVADARATTDLVEFFQGSQPTYTAIPALEPPSFFTGAKAQEGPPAPPDNDGDDD